MLWIRYQLFWSHNFHVEHFDFTVLDSFFYCDYFPHFQYNCSCYRIRYDCSDSMVITAPEFCYLCIFIFASIWNKSTNKPSAIHAVCIRLRFWWMNFMYYVRNSIIDTIRMLNCRTLNLAPYSSRKFIATVTNISKLNNCINHLFTI